MNAPVMRQCRKAAFEVRVTNMAVEIGQAGKGVGDAPVPVTAHAEVGLPKRETLTPLQCALLTSDHIGLLPKPCLASSTVRRKTKILINSDLQSPMSSGLCSSSALP